VSVTPSPLPQNLPATAGGAVRGIAARRLRAKSNPSEQYQATRAKLFRAAGEVFREQGVTRSSLGDISDRSGIDRATIYYYFESKEELFKELISDVMVKNVADAERIAKSGEPSAVKLRLAMRALLRSIAEHDPYVAVYIDEFLPRTPVSDAFPGMNEVRGIAKRYDDAISRIIHEGVECGAFRRIADDRTVAFMVVGMMNSSVRWLRAASIEKALQTAEEMCDLCVGGLEIRP
jgi:TetR/AcrR family transcriptional regulator, cholesterol catabolism regulator